MAKVQSVNFNKKKWSLPDAKKYLLDRGFTTKGVHITDEQYQFRQLEPKTNGKFRTHNFDDNVEYIIMY